MPGIPRIFITLQNNQGKIIGQDIAGKTKETIGEAVSRLEPNASVQVFYVPIPDSEKKVTVLGLVGISKILMPSPIDLEKAFAKK